MNFIEDLKQKVNNYIDNQALDRLEHRVRLIMSDRKELEGWTDKELRLAAAAFREDLAKGKRLDTIVVPGFSVVNEAARRILGKTPYPVQILAGLVIHSGRIAEMKAGEGKTLTETMPVYLNALSGRGVHIITTNDYLAERDAKEMGKLYEFLGLSVGYVTSTMKNEARRKAYAADITYVTNQEVGFDYLRDNLVFTRKDRVLRPDHPLHFGIVDEIDSILIDESRTPLIIAESVKEEMSFYDTFIKIVDQLAEDKDYVVDYVHKGVNMTNDGLNHVEQLLGEPLFSKENPMYVFYLDVCLRAKTLFEKDRDYIISEGGVEIVDEFTGRVLPGRRFTDGVHQAIEAKERVKVKESDRTQAAVTFQNFFPMYEKLSGMSGTVLGAREEFNTVYKLDVVQIPTNRQLARIDHNDLFFKTQKGKFQSLIKKVKVLYKRGQPLLIGARNVETAHLVSGLLEKENIPHQMLTAADHKLEAEKIAKAGQEGMVTVATNMAGRGTDIVLGPGVENMGGLYVLGTERHESRRIDDQLVGRAGRQGDPGESQFLISMEDEIMQLFGSEKIINAMEEYDIPEDEYISGKSLTESFRKAQKFVESKNYDSRIYLYKYDSVTSFQRKTVYELRERLLENEPEFAKFMENSLSDVIEEIFKIGVPGLIAKEIRAVFGVPVDEAELSESLGSPGREPSMKETFNELLNPFYKPQDKTRQKHLVIQKLYSYLHEQLLRIKGEPEVYQAAQNLVLEIIDSQWGKHLELMDALKEQANLFSYASEDPLIDFILESRKLFTLMGSEIQKQFVKSIFIHLNQSSPMPSSPKKVTNL